MITKFKIFESRIDSIKKELVDILDDDDIEEYFSDHLSYTTVEEILDFYPSIIWNHINDDRYVEDYIQYEISNRDFNYHFSEDEYKDYVENNMNSDKENAIVNIYCDKMDIKKNIKTKIDGIVSITEKNDKYTITVTPNQKGKPKKYKIPKEHEIIVNDGDYVSIGDKLSKIEYDWRMYDELEDEDWKTIISEVNEEDDFIEKIITDRYSDYDAKGIFEEIYGRVDNVSGEDLYRWFYNYVDDDALIQDYNENEDFDYKKERVSDSIYESIDLQEKILEKEPGSVLLLSKLFIKEKSNTNISDNYDFQKTYIEEYVKNYLDIEDLENEDLKEEIGEAIADALYYLDKHFNLNDDILEEYNEYAYKVMSKKYNF